MGAFSLIVVINLLNRYKMSVVESVKPQQQKLFIDVPSEDVSCRKLDIALKDTAIKSGTGVAIGGIFSLLFRRRRWPLVLGLGVGLGMGVANFQHSLKLPLPRIYEIPSPTPQIEPKTTEKTQ